MLGKLAQLHDSPWTMITLGRVARKQGVEEVAAKARRIVDGIKGKLPRDAFEEVRELILAFLAEGKEVKRRSMKQLRQLDRYARTAHLTVKNEAQLRKTLIQVRSRIKDVREKMGTRQFASGLCYITRKTNFDYFDDKQKAELFRLKAVFYMELEQYAWANTVFSQAMHICDSYGKGWISWGKYYDGMFESNSNRAVLYARIAAKNEKEEQQMQLLRQQFETKEKREREKKEKEKEEKDGATMDVDSGGSGSGSSSGPGSNKSDAAANLVAIDTRLAKLRAELRDAQAKSAQMRAKQMQCAQQVGSNLSSLPLFLPLYAI